MMRSHFAPVVMEKSQAAFYLSVSSRKFDDLIAQGRVTPYRLDGKRVFKRDDLDEIARELPEWKSA